MSEVFDIGIWLQWFSQLDRTFVFLLALPFVVAVVGLWAAYRDREVERREHEEKVVDRESTVDRSRRGHSPRMGGHRYN
ncbi:MAG TPA: hypothetical protein VFP00_04555 [Burkholderiales bacterium]|nr:hypothetical protein [Burkholderiales bacterium]